MFDRLKNLLNSAAFVNTIVGQAREDRASPNVKNDDNVSSKSPDVNSYLKLPDLASTKIYQGDRLWEQGKFTEAIKLYRQAVEIEPNAGLAHQKLAVGLQKIGKIPEAMIHYRKAIMLNNSWTEEGETSQSQLSEPWQEAVALHVGETGEDSHRNFSTKLQLPDFDSHSTQYRQLSAVYSSDKSSFSFKLIEKPSANQERVSAQSETNHHSGLEAARIYLQQALAYCDRQEWQQAIVACQQAIEIEPHSAEAYKIWGNALQRSGKTAEAMGYYAKAIAIQPDLAEVYANLGSLYAGQKQWQQAIEYYQKAIIINPKFAGAYENLAKVCQQLGETNKFWHYHHQALSLEPERAKGKDHIFLADWLRENNQLEEAVIHYRYGIKLEPKLQEEYQKLIQVLKQLGRWQEAASYEQTSHYQNRLEGDHPLEQKLLSTSEIVLPSPNQVQEKITTSTNSVSTEALDLNIAKYRQKAQNNPNSAAIYSNLGSLYAQKQHWQEAINCYQQAIKLNPHLAGVYRNLARALEKADQSAEAITYWYHAYSLEPGSVKAEEHLQLGNACLKHNRLKEAVTCYSRALELSPNLAEAYLHLGEILHSKGKLEEAIQYYRKAVQSNPQIALHHYRLGFVFTQQKQWQEAIVCYQQAIKLESDYWEACHHLGDAFSKVYRWEEAVAAYQAAIKVKDDFCWTHNNLGDALVQLRRWQEAEVAFKKASELNPDFPWSYYNLGEIFSNLARWDEAVAAYRRAIELKPDLPTVEIKLADALGHRSKIDSDRAFSYYQREIQLNPDNLHNYYKAIALQPDNGKLYLQLGNALVKQNQLERAVVYYQIALQYQPQNREISTQLAKLLPGQTHFNQKLLLSSPSASLKEQPEKAEALLAKAKTYLGENQIDLAIVALNAALEFHPNYPEAYFQLGNALTKQADLDRAIKCYRQALQLEPNNCWYYNGYGDALKGRYDLAEAISAYSRAIELNPDFAGFYENKEQSQQLLHRWQQVIDYCEQLKQTECQDQLKILLITPYPAYPPNTGGAIRMFEEIKYLGSRHHLTVVSFIFDEADYQIEEDLQEYCNCAMMVKLGVPLAPRRVDQQKQLYQWGTWNMWKVLQQLSQIKFDAVLFDFIFATPYHELFKNHLTILNEHNIESRILKQCATITESDITTAASDVEAVKVFLDSERESKLLETYENKTWSKFALTTLVSEDDRQELLSRCPNSKAIVVKNGIDTHNITPVNNSQAQKMLYMGTMTYYPNIDAVLYFTEEILPLIRQQNPKLPFCIAGREPSAEIQALATRYSDLEIIASPKNMSDVAQNCSIAIVPIRLGSGTRIKILHAMAMGLPVISTSLGCEGLEVTDGENILIRDTPKEFAEAVIQVSNDFQLKTKLSVNGRRLVEQTYDWQNIFARYEQEILTLIETRPK
ncbi:glycosyl transferase group 1 [Stanieria cyanosphaera PCC 7437]|uniref:Glycosyl transferase group 1 n=1 Tax=Stanieria cyanosphaera (strain ATCC 29371 / PCC 7437) TaxID=111780 RepID=K9XX58_STAC7|nr:tetratricopeptide repeat protein [Stanieria cyanosphaera]AFZ36257.1 glycosyl transferase group 1 [Stanieria cyanosphaera PCC 7437]